MSILVFAFTRQGVVVADGAIAANQLINMASSGEAFAIPIKTADVSAPAVKQVWSMSDAVEISRSKPMAWGLRTKGLMRTYHCLDGKLIQEWLDEDSKDELEMLMKFRFDATLSGALRT
jgi:hypothetical protein